MAEVGGKPREIVLRLGQSFFFPSYLDILVNRELLIMAAGCPHVKNAQLAADKSFLNPRAWACMDCGFTDSVWVSGNVVCLCLATPST